MPRSKKEDRPGRPGGRRLRRAASGLGLLAALWAAGLVAFVAALPRGLEEIQAADGIVVLTGGADRLDVAMGLLNDHKGKRLLISGVHPDTTREDIRQLVGASVMRFDCCVDLDRTALNTNGNAVETARWARGHDYSSLIVVTASYHMPRSLLEFQQEMPDVALVPMPVFPDKVSIDEWWHKPMTARLLVSEYTKYLLTRARVAFYAATGQNRRTDTQVAIHRPA
jgi:uncharacterized SAM-binding protein YcdF (DUF218 family)